MDIREVLTELGASLYTHAKLAGVAEEAEAAATYLGEHGVDMRTLVSTGPDEE